MMRQKTIYLTLTANGAGGVDIAASDATLGGGSAAGCEHMDAVRRMAWDVMAAARIRGARVGGLVEADRVNPVLLVALAQAVLDPEVFGHAVTNEVRDMARMALGGRARESGLCPSWVAPRGAEVAPQTATDRSAA